MMERRPNDHTSRDGDEGRAGDVPSMHIAEIRPDSCPLFWHLRGGEGGEEENESLSSQQDGWLLDVQ